MPIVAKASGGNFIPAPAGTHAAVCVDVVDLGILKVEYAGQAKQQHKVNIVWQLEEQQPDGKPFSVRKRYTLSLHEKAALRKDLESWRGKAFTEDELRGFDLEVLIGKPALLNVIRASRGGSEYANVATIMRLPKMMEAPTQRDYVRVCDRPGANGGSEIPDYSNYEDDGPPPNYDIDEVPF